MTFEKLPNQYFWFGYVRIGRRIYKVLFRFRNWHLLIPIVQIGIARAHYYKNLK